MHQPSPLALESSRASIGAGSSASAGHSAAHAAGLHHGHAAHADSAAAAAAAGKKQTVREFVFTVVEQAKAQIAARMDSLTGGAGFAIGGDATELDTDGNAAGGSESGANEGSAEFGVSGNAIHKPPSKDLFLLHAAQGALDFLEQRLGMGGAWELAFAPCCALVVAVAQSAAMTLCIGSVASWRLHRTPVVRLQDCLSHSLITRACHAVFAFSTAARTAASGMPAARLFFIPTRIVQRTA